MSNRWFRRFLALCPTAIAVLWVAGIAHFRAYALSRTEWAMIVAAAFGLGAIAQRMQRGRPVPKLPEHANPATMAALAAAIIGVLALPFGGVLEVFAETVVPSETSWALRTTWHAACAFAASYCMFLLRLTPPLQKRPGGPAAAR